MLEKIFSLDNRGVRSLHAGIIMTALSNVCTVLPTVLMLLLVSRMVESLFSGESLSISLFLYWGIALVLLLVIYFVYTATYKKTYLAAYEESSNTRIKLAEKIRHLPLSYFGSNDLSALTSTLMYDVTTVEKTLSSGLAELFGGIISSCFIIVTLLLFNWKMALSLFACLPVSLLILYLSKIIGHSFTVKNREAKLEMSDRLQEYLENIKIIKSSEQRENFKDRVKAKIRKVVRTSIIDELVMGIFLSGAYNAIRIGFGIIVTVGSYLITNGELSIITYLLFIFVAAEVYDPLTVAFFKTGELLITLVSAKRIREMNEYPVQEGKDDVSIDSFDIEFQDVSFGYNQDAVIHNVSFIARQGEITALVGPSGCGKSTISKLAARFWDIKSGRILIGGKDINKISPETLLQYFSIVFQDVVLFNDTIFNNIKIGKKDATSEEVAAAAKMAGCMEFINRLPEKMDTVIGENGKTLSGGERQRISIARAFLKDAPIVLLDEATASLDPENETLIQSAIGQLIKDKTVMIIAHRLRSVENCNKIIVLNEGKIEDSGSHSELLKHKELYQHLFELQRESSEWKI